MPSASHGLSMPEPKQSMRRSRWRQAVISSRARLKLISDVQGRRSRRWPMWPGCELNQAQAAMNMKTSSGGLLRSGWRAIHKA
jgi:hypothetical protein